MSGDLPTGRQRKIWMWLMLALGAGLATLLWAFSFLPCSGAPDASACGAQPTSWLYAYCCAAQKNPPWILISGIAAAPALILTWWWRTQHKDKELGQRDQDIALARREQRSTRFLESSKQLWSSSLAGRLAGIYSLQALASESSDDLPHVLQLLCTFIRTHHSGDQEDARHAFTSLSRLPIPEVSTPRHINDSQPDTFAIDLTGAHLASADVSLGKLRHAILVDATLNELSAVRTDFRGANFTRASLNNANFWRANLNQADMFEASLENASLVEANLVAAELGGSVLTGANLQRADLRDAQLVGARLGGARLEEALFNEKTVFPKDFDPERAGMRRLKGPADVEPGVSAPTA